MAENTPSIVSDITNVPPGTTHRPLTRKGTGSKISDYFESRASSPTRQHSFSDSDRTAFASSSPATEQKSEGDATDVEDARSDTESSGDAPKKLKITTSNGWEASRRLAIHSKKRVKREFFDDSTGGTGSIFRRQNPRAKLGLLPSLPLDVMFEIFRHLLPLDLIQLARATKALRALLLHRSATGLWKGAFSNIPGLPACPDDVSLPSWANLAFDSHCHQCQTRNATKCVDFVLRVRYCGKCVKTELLRQSDFNKEIKIQALILRAVPFSEYERYSGVKYCVKHQRDAFLKELVCHKGDRTAFMEECRALVKSRTKKAKAWKKWHESQISNRDTEICNIRSERMLAIRDKLSDLGFDEELALIDELEDNYPNHGLAILPTPKYIRFRELDVVKVTKPLTDRIWTNIEGEMVAYMEEMRSLRLRHERCLVVRTRSQQICDLYIAWRTHPNMLAEYPTDVFMPSVADVLEFSAAQALADKDGDERLTEDEMTGLTRLFPACIQLWQFTSTAALWKMTWSMALRHGLLSGIYDEADYLERMQENLQLVVNVFRCKNEGNFDHKWLVDEGITGPHQYIYDSPEIREPCLFYPDFFFHSCTSMKRRQWEERFAQAHEYLSMSSEYKGYRRASWKVDNRLEFDEKASRIVRNLLDAAELDYMETTVTDMDTFDHRFVCLKCSFGNKCDGQRKVRVWTWRDAVQHCLKTHFGDGSVKWEVISTEDAIEARKIEANEHTKRGYLKPEQQKLYKCISCRDTPVDMGRVSWSVLKTHFRNNRSHGDPDDMEGKEDINYYKARGYFPRERPRVRMIPAATK